MQFDAYAASIKGGQKLGDVAICLADSLEGIVSNGKPMRRFAKTLNIDSGNRSSAWVGEDASTGLIYVEGKGATTPQLAKALREHFPGHSAPRIDVAEDYDCPRAFEALQQLVRANKGERVKGGYVALPDDVQDGKTWAAGVRGGVGYIRVYEAGKHPDRLCMQRPHWVRAELECRPQYARDKAAAAHMTPLEVWGMSAWTQRVGEALTTVPIPRFEPEVRTYAHGKTQRYVALRYRRMWEEMLRNGEHFQATIQEIWKEEDKWNRRH